MNNSPAAQWRHGTTGFVDRQFIPHKTMNDELVPLFLGFSARSAGWGRYGILGIRVQRVKRAPSLHETIECNDKKP